MNKLIEEDMNAPDESPYELDDSVHHKKEIKEIEETNKHYTATVEINGVKKEVVLTPDPQ